jgi:hypothetical protein
MNALARAGCTDDRHVHCPRASARCLHRSKQKDSDQQDSVVDTNGLPVRLALTAGEAHDNRLAGSLLKNWISVKGIPGLAREYIREIVRKPERREQRRA